MNSLSERIAALPAAKKALLMRQLAMREGIVDVATDHYDVAILGGGLAGLTLALQLKRSRPGIHVVVVERQQHPAPETTHKVGESTVEIGAHYLRDILGLKEHLDTKQLRKFGLRMFFADRDNDDITQRVEIGSTVFPPLATYQLDRGRLENVLAETIVQAGVEFLDGSSVDTLSLRAEEMHHCVQVRTPTGNREIRARWVVDASGRTQLLKRQLGLRKPVGHAANAVWFRIGHPLDIKQWTGDAAWQKRVSHGDRALSTNHLMGSGYWVWLIRLASDAISVGIVTDANAHAFNDLNRFERAMNWLRQHEPQCAEMIETHRDRLQDFSVMRNYSYSCTQVFSGEQRWSLTGEAGIFLDPLYSPGIDMIAIANGLTVDLISRHLDGEDVHARASVHDSLFLRVADMWLAVYEQQYTLMGNAQVMTTKVIWDTAFYWGVFGLLYFQEKFETVTDSPSVVRDLERLEVLSNRIQKLFREWSAIDQTDVRERFIDLYEPLDFMVKLHEGMAADLSPSEFEGRFADNVVLFEQLAGQLVSAIIDAYANHPEMSDAFEQIRRWQAEPFVAALISTYRAHPNRGCSRGLNPPVSSRLLAM